MVGAVRLVLGKRIEKALEPGEQAIELSLLYEFEILATRDASMLRMAEFLSPNR